MQETLRAQLADFLGHGRFPPGDHDQGLETLLEDATLVALVLRPSPTAMGWLAACRTPSEAVAGSTSPGPGVVARCRIASVAAELVDADSLTPTQADGLLTHLNAAIEALEMSGGERAAAIAHLVAGHVAIYLRDDALRVSNLREAENNFASAASTEADAFVKVLAKLRGAEVSLLTRRPRKHSVMAAQESLFEALDASADSQAPSARTAAQIDAELRAGIGVTSFLLSTANGAGEHEALDLAIASLSYATRQPDGLPRGSLRWAKAMLALASAWGSLSDLYALPTAYAGSQGDRFAAALESQSAALYELCEHARLTAPEIWARAHDLLARIQTQLPGKDITSALEHRDAAQGILSRQTCPEIWSKLQSNRALIVLNHALVHRDEAGIDEGLRLMEHAADIDDPLLDTIRNAHRRLGETLRRLGRPEAAIAVLERAAEAAEFVVTRAIGAEAQRAEFGILAAILKELTSARLEHAGVVEAVLSLVHAVELDFAFDVVFARDPQRSMDASERTARLVLGMTQEERSWNDWLPFARTETELSALRREAGHRVAEIVSPAVAERRRLLDQRLARVRPEALVPPGGALVLPLVTGKDATFVVLLADRDDVKVEAVPAPRLTQTTLTEAVYGWGIQDGWLPAYSRSLTTRLQETSFGQLPAILESPYPGMTQITLLPGDAVDPAKMTPKEPWITALDTSVRAAWHIFEPLHEFLSQRLPSGSTVLLAGEPQLSMLPLAGAWRQVAQKARELVSDWSLGLTPSLAALPEPLGVFRLGPGDAVLVCVDQTATLQFAEWEQVALLDAPGGPRLQVLGGRRRARRADVIDALAGSTAAHFACHARYEHDDPLGSVIRLSDDDTLTAREIVELDLSATKLIVLSACESGMVNARTADPARYIGLATAFLEAGAERVIAPLWSVNDVSTLLLMDQFYSRLVDGPPVHALRESMMRLRDLAAIEAVAALQGLVKRAGAISASSLNRPHPGSLNDVIAFFAGLPPDSRPFQSPYFWAGFVHYGAPT